MDETTVQAASDSIESSKITAPCITREYIDSLVQGVSFWQPVGTTLTVAVLFLKNGSIVTGESACVSMGNYDTVVGQQMAVENAVEKIWALEGYLLKEKLSGGLTVPLPVEAVLEGSI